VTGSPTARISTAARTWGSTRGERQMSLPCDRHLRHQDMAVHRAVDVAAPAPVVFRWLCQLRAAPYSYDWIDNLGRRSPRELTPGLDDLEVGQSVMTIFRLVEFERDHHLTIFHRGAAGTFAVTYVVLPAGPDRSRLVVKLAVAYPRLRLAREAVARLGPAADLVMMRKQLLNLRRLAERDHRRTRMPRLPRIDEHAVEVEATLERTWTALASLLFGARRGPARLVGPLLDLADRGPQGEPLAEGSRLLGFHVVESTRPRCVVLEGEHRFSLYRLTFELEPLGVGRTRLRAITDADFPRAAGRVYRAVVIGTRAHVLAVRGLLREIERRAEG
jgi:hypothetical protein